MERRKKKSYAFSRTVGIGRCSRRKSGIMLSWRYKIWFTYRLRDRRSRFQRFSNDNINRSRWCFQWILTSILKRKTLDETRAVFANVTEDVYPSFIWLITDRDRNKLRLLRWKGLIKYANLIVLNTVCSETNLVFSFFLSDLINLHELC